MPRAGTGPLKRSWPLKGEGGYLVVRGFCARCGREAGGLFSARLWQCPKCRVAICDACVPDKRVGVIFKKPGCPDCLLELIEGGIYVGQG